MLRCARSVGGTVKGTMRMSQAGRHLCAVIVGAFLLCDQRALSEARSGLRVALAGATRRPVG
jgi:hypothetical protein